MTEVKYNGYTATPSDYECSDGDMALSLGMVPEDGAIRSIRKPEVVMELEEGDTVKYIHKTSYYKHYIILNAGNLAWKEDDGAGVNPLHTFGNTAIHQVTGVGNTLLVLAEDGMHYFLWKDSSYLYLGTHIPECPLSFGLQGELIRSDAFDITFDKIAVENAYKEFSEENKDKVTGQVLAKVNKFIAEHSTDAGRFMFPFFVRYAYRLYDGSLTMCSAPIMMVASSGIAPQVFYDSFSPENGNARLRVVGVAHKLDYAADIFGGENIAELQKWKDIVTSVDIFISKPIYTYEQGGKCTQFKKINDDDTYCVCYHANQAPILSVPEEQGRYPVKYQKNRFSKLYAYTYAEDYLYEDYYTCPDGRLMIPERKFDDVSKEIKDCAQFYLLESVKVEQLTEERKTIDVKEDYLKALVAREAMKEDDYDSHDMLIPKYAFPYNSRLNIANVNKKLFVGHAACSLFNYSSGYVPVKGVGTLDTPDTEHVFVYVYIKQDGKTVVVKSDGGVFGLNAPILYLYYPNPNAYKAVIDRSLYGQKLYEVPLEKHAFLNGAFYFGGWEDISKLSSEPIPDDVNDEVSRTVEIHNKIYTSEVNNPFYFPFLGINTVGTGEILGISSAAKALSEGQFGQFPLYAFTTDGVWALEVSSTGAYSARQPITRDVCINPDSITQIDSAVLFTTDRGIMIVSGSNAQCISDTINAEEMFSIEDLPRHGELLYIYNGFCGTEYSLGDVAMLPFNDFLEGCRMVYDYTHQRIIVYNSRVRYAYVYSIKSKSWGMMLSDIYASVNSYPQALAMSARASGGVDMPVLVDFSISAEPSPGLLVTRPLKLDPPNVFKTINTIIQRGMFKYDHVIQVLYGSNDLYNWHIVWSSTNKYLRGFSGTPYKFFRMAMVCSLSNGESIYGCSVRYGTRKTNKPR